MGAGLGANNPVVVSAFRAALYRQGLLVLVLAAVLAVVWAFARASRLRRALAGGADDLDQLACEPPGLRLVRVGFGLLWVLDGLLQLQSQMPLGLVPQVILPAASGSPKWVTDLVSSAANVWSYHPVSAAAATVWIQLSLGLWLLFSPPGELRRLAGVASAAWALVVWVFGEAFGSLFAPGLSWMFGAPGAAVFYALAGVAVALPPRIWATPRPGRVILRAMGLMFIGFALLQAWPGRGFYRGGGARGAQGSLLSMVLQMSQTSQPAWLSSWLRSFASFDASHGFAVNVFVVSFLAVVGVALASCRPALVRPALAVCVVVCLADWVLVEDLGFLGGVGTDPNSMVPTLLIVFGGYLALTRPAVASAKASSSVELGLLFREPALVFRAAGTVAAILIGLIGVVPMAKAASSSQASPILARAVDGPPQAVDFPAPAFSLTDQQGRPVSLASLRGKVVALTFLDPVCTVDCPTIAAEFREADSLLSADRSRVEFVAIDANPQYLSEGFLRAFDSQERLSGIPNWLFLTGRLPILTQVWRSYGVEVSYEPGGGMIDHSEIAYVIGPDGHTRFVLDADPGPATSATQSSFASTLVGAIKASAGL